MEIKMLDNKTIGQHLKNYRNEKGKTVAEVSEETGIGATALRNYECGIRVPRWKAMIRLAEYYQTTVDAIFFCQK